MKSREEEREERQRYENDVFYEVWRSGGNPDRIDYDTIDDARNRGVPSDDCALSELRRQRPRRHEEDGEEP